MDVGWSSSTDVARAGAVPLDALLALSNDGFFFVGSDAHVREWSRSAAVLSGIPPTGAIAHDVRQLFLHGDRIVAVGFDGTPHEVRLALETAGGVTWLRASVIAVNLDAQTYGWFCSFGPERRYREIEQLKNEIVAAVSHELKTPIASIKAYATTMAENPEMIATQRDEFLRVIDEQTDRLARAVDDLLLASRVDAEQLLKRRLDVPLDAIVDEVCRALEAQGTQTSVRRQTHGVSISGDPELLREIFIHLIDNARKFSSPESSVEIEGAAGERETVVSIRDRGIGIHEEHLPYIFERFYRVESELTTSTGGVGLGLSIVQSLVRAHGGSIAVASEPGLGTTFTLRFPARASA